MSETREKSQAEIWPEWVKDGSYLVCTVLTELLVAAAIDRRVLGQERVPRKGAFVLVANHISHFDPPLIGSPLWRRVNWLTASDLYMHPAIEMLFESLGCIRFERGRRDARALKNVLASLKSGVPVGIFPEGGIRHGKASVLCGADMEESAWQLAWRAQVPVVNALIVGADALYSRRAWPKFAPVYVAYSFAIQPDEQDGEGVFIQKCAESLARLREEVFNRWEINDSLLPRSAQEHWAAES